MGWALAAPGLLALGLDTLHPACFFCCGHRCLLLGRCELLFYVFLYGFTFRLHNKVTYQGYGRLFTFRGCVDPSWETIEQEATQSPRSRTIVIAIIVAIKGCSFSCRLGPHWEEIAHVCAAFHCKFEVTAPRICVSVYILRRYEFGGVWLFVGGPTGMKVVVLGGHVIVGLSKQWIAQPGLATWSRIEMVVGGHAQVCK